ncbi:hypothetical protein EXIGLDRAFT_841618 [Exidia glandulosa HHB12029]|uniref:F-box domain-containing protein n=1 Tax=Exidia glandulosa HHB12029 TaxID=1314781 RepID=A0A165ZRJ6_EXIGL|nr:hypothetical protein EXIGLDRAFT_841618 [Exidia glandulosa HHB12029]
MAKRLPRMRGAAQGQRSKSGRCALCPIGGGGDESDRGKEKESRPGIRVCYCVEQTCASATCTTSDSIKSSGAEQVQRRPTSIALDGFQFQFQFQLQVRRQCGPTRPSRADRSVRVERGTLVTKRGSRKSKSAQHLLLFARVLLFPMPAPELAPELWDLIIDFLPSPHDLARCARVCRAWKTRCIARLYYSLVFTRRNERLSAAQFDDLVQSKSAVVQYVRHLEIRDDSEGLGGRDPSALGMLDVSASDDAFGLSYLITLAHALGSIPSSSNNISHLTLSGRGSAGWSILGPVVRNGFVNTVRSRTGLNVGVLFPLPRSNDFLRGVCRISSLDVSWNFSWEEFSEFVSYLPLLTRLTVRGNIDHTVGLGAGVAIPRFEKPCEVYILTSTGAPLLEWAALDMGRIRGLHISNYAFARYLCRVPLGRLPHSVVLVKTLALEVSGKVGDGSDAKALLLDLASLPRFPSLTHLHLRLHPFEALGDLPSLSWNSLAVPSTLAHLTITTSLSPSPPLARLLEVLDIAFRSVESVQLVFLAQDSPPSDSCIAIMMPRAHARGALKVRSVPTLRGGEGRVEMDVRIGDLL